MSTWHFPEPMKTKKLTTKEEHQLFLDLAEEFGKMLETEIKINNGFPVDFEDTQSKYINFSGRGMQLEIYLKPNQYFGDSSIAENTIKIAWFWVAVQNQGIGTRLMKHFLNKVSRTSYQRIHLDTRDDKGRRFWRRMGFKPYYDDIPDSRYDWHLLLPKS